jgi:hypothetical protein
MSHRDTMQPQYRRRKNANFRFVSATLERLQALAERDSVTTSAVISQLVAAGMRGELGVPGVDFLRWHSHAGVTSPFSRRLPERTRAQIRGLADEWGLSGANVVEFLVWARWNALQ